MKALKGMCISKEFGLFGLYLSATPDFLFRFKGIDGLFGTGEAKSRKIVELDNGINGFVLQLKSDSCISYDR
jgi:hypothetical protein